MWVALPFWCFLNVYVSPCWCRHSTLGRMVNNSDWTMGALVLLGIDWERDWLVIVKVCLAPSNTMQVRIENTNENTTHKEQFNLWGKWLKKWLAVMSLSFWPVQIVNSGSFSFCFFCFLDFNAFRNSKPFSSNVWLSLSANQELRKTFHNRTDWSTECHCPMDRSKIYEVLIVRLLLLICQGQ